MNGYAEGTLSATAEAQERENMTSWEVGQRERDAVEAAANTAEGDVTTPIAPEERELCITPTAGGAASNKLTPVVHDADVALSFTGSPEAGTATSEAARAAGGTDRAQAVEVAAGVATEEAGASAPAISTEYAVQDGGIARLLSTIPTPDAPRVAVDGLEWVQLYDAEEQAPYWYCEATQVAQWEQPDAPAVVERLSQTDLLFSEAVTHSLNRHSRIFSFKAADSNFDFSAFDTDVFASEAAACEVVINSDHTVTAMATSEAEAREKLTKLGLPDLDCTDVGGDAAEAAATPSNESAAQNRARAPSKTPRAAIPKGMLGSLPDPAEVELAKRESKRLYTVEEIIVTEDTYFHRLKATWEVYVVPLRQVGILNSADIDCMFFMWESIMGLHKDFFGALRREREAGQLAEKVGALFSQYSHLFKMYQPYLNNFSKASDLRTTLLLESKHFHEFCQAARKHAQCGNQSLMELMCEPIQRIPRYKLLLQQLIKYTPDTSPHKEGIEAALARISEVAVAIDHGIHESNEARKNHEILVDIMMSFTWNTRINLLDDPSRYLIKSGMLNRQTRSKIRPFFFWLFTDKLVYGDEVPGLEGNYIVHRDLPLDACRASVPPPRLECANRERALFIESSQKSFIVWAETADEAKEWNNAIIETVTTYRNKVSAKSGREGIAPMWTPNNATTSCECCDVEFGMLTFKHHCRKCGAIVCAGCSSFSFRLPNVDKYKDVRVCDSCFMACVEESAEYASLDDYFEKKRIAQEATVVGSLKNSIGGLFGLRKSNSSMSSSTHSSPVPISPSASSKSANFDSDNDQNGLSAISSTSSRPASTNLS